MNLEGSGWPGLMRLEITSGRGYLDGGNATTRLEMPPFRTGPKRRGHQMRRKKRVARYRMYGVEGRVRISIKNGLRWLKKRCSLIIRGY